jgi:hypothetical protein
MAWLWSGVETVTAWISLPTSSNIFRQSVYRLAFECFSAILASRFSSMSQMATRLVCLAAWSQSLSPLPPTPTQARPIRSLGLLESTSSAHVRRSLTQKPMPMPARVVAAVPLRKSRRLVR